MCLVGLVVLLSACGGGGGGGGTTGGGAQNNCRGSGTLTVTISPCPLQSNILQGTSATLGLSASVQGTVSGNVYTYIVDPTGTFLPGPVTLTQISPSQYSAQLDTSSSLTTGQHTGSLDVKICGDAACGNVYVEVFVPYTLTLAPPPPPAISSVSPTSALAGSSQAHVTISGSGFLPGGNLPSVRWTYGGVTQTLPVPLGGASDTQLLVTVPGSDLTLGGTATITVTTASPWSVTSNSEVFTINNLAPTVAWVWPQSAYVGSPDMTVTVKGANFSSVTSVQWNGAPLKLTSQSSTLLQATLPAADMATATTTTLSVVNAAPGGGTINRSYIVATPAPVISALAPGFAAPGASAFTLTVSGAHFDPNAVVDWSGVALTTTYVSSSKLQAAVPAADVVSAGIATVTVANPPASGGTSGKATFAIAAGGTSTASISQSLNDIAWDSQHFVLYASTPATASTHPSSVVVLDPVAAAVSSSVATSTAPNLLSVSSDGGYLYASFDATSSVGRYTLPAIASDISFSIQQNALFPDIAAAMQASPVFPHLVAVSVSEQGSCCQARPSVFDDTVGSGVSDQYDMSWYALGWSHDGAHVYGGESTDSSHYFAVSDLSIDTATATHDYAGVWGGGSMQVDAGSGLVYIDQSNKVLDPTTGKVVGTFPVTNNAIVPDSALGCVYMVYQTAAQGGTQNYTVSCYDPSLYTVVRSAVVASVNGFPLKLLRWGNEGLVFDTSAGYIYFVSGQVVTGP